MNNYHLYEEIGHGKFSIVYKARKRHTISYVAVKSIEKTRREKVMVEVRVLSQIKHVNVVGFVNWYETRNHLWIIFEYCAGGDVLRLLKQDGRLPEDQVRLFGRDVCAGLLHVHACSIIYSDLKPANVLFNENGVLKLSDFGHAQHLDELRRLMEERAPFPRRGTPHYMAPELLQEGGMHSFASDLWALGCVIYELLVGRPPFHSSTFQHLQQMVLCDPLPLTVEMSADLQALLASLLRKAPLDRFGWAVLRAHAFWQGRPPGDDLDADALPTQPHLEELQRMWQGLCGAPTPVSRGSSMQRGDSYGPAQQSEPTGYAGQRSRNRSYDAAAEYTAEDVGTRDAREPPSQASETRELGCGSEGTLVEAPAAPQAADTAPVPLVCQPSAPASQSAGSLRSRLGATMYTRIRELLTAIERGVRPISRNPQIEEPEALDVHPNLPFPPLNLDEVCSQPHADLEAFLTKVYTCIAQGATEDKLAALRYLEHICCQQIRAPQSCQVQIADLVINSSLLRLVLRILHVRRGGSQGRLGSGGAPASAAAAPPLRARLLSLIGQLLRHATYLEPSVADLGLFDVLLEGLAEHDVLLRRKSVAALGELLFYIATQPAQERRRDPGLGVRPASQCGAEGLPPEESQQGWQVPGTVLEALSQVLLSPGGDEVAQHYAAKTVENVATQCPAVAQRWFFSPDALQGLSLHVRRSSWDAFRLSCLAALSHLLRGAAEHEVAALPPLGEPELVTLGLTALAPQGVPHGLQLVVVLLLRAPNLSTVAAALPESIVDLLMGVVAQPRYNSGLRGRAAVLLALLFALDDCRTARHLRAALERSFVPHVDRLGREKDRLVVQCVAASTSVLDVVAFSLLQGVIEGLRQLASATSTSATTSLAAGLVQVLPALLHLVSSAVLCTCILNSRALPLLGAVCELTARTPLPPMQLSTNQPLGPLFQLQPIVLMFIEALTAQQGLVLEHAPQMVRCILPALAAYLPSNRSDVRLLALKSFSGICIMFLNDRHIFEPATEQPSETTTLLEALLCSRVLPTLSTLLDDEPPTPSYASRLLATLLSRGSKGAGLALRDLRLAPQLLAALRGEHSLTLPSALLAHCLLQRQEVRVRDLQSVGVLSSVHAALVEAAEAAVGHAAQLDFAMLDAALGIAEEAYAQQLDASLAEQACAPQLLLAELGELAHALPLLAALCAPLARAKLAALLDRTATCAQQLAGLLGCAAPDRGRRSAPPGDEALLVATQRLSLQGATGLMEALATAARWRQDTAATRGVLRRLLAVLGWAVKATVDVDVLAEVASGVDRLLRDHALGDDPAVTADAHSLLAATGRATC